jgi:phosphatidylglycerophosphatase A
MDTSKPLLLVRLGLSSFGTGYIPRGGGTAASILALFPAWFLAPYPFILAAVIAILFALGVWGSFYAERRGWANDDSRITIDEFCGMLVALLWLRLPSSPLGSILVFASAFIIFRLLDVLKPPPLRFIERLPGGWAVMADDLAAGLVTNGLVRLILLIPLPLLHHA